MSHKEQLKNFLDGPGEVLLLVEGGALRSINTLGMLQALSERGYRDKFSAISGMSGGVFNAAFFISDELDKAKGIYSDVLAEKPFRDLTRIRRLIDVDVLADRMKNHSKYKLNVSKIINSETKLIQTLSNIDSWSLEQFDLRKYPDMVVDILCAGGYAPVLSNQIFNFKGKRYVDGSVIVDIPLSNMLADFDRVLILRSSSNQSMKRHRLLFVSAARFAYGQPFSVGWRVEKENNQNKIRFNQEIENPNVMQIFSDSTDIKYLTKDKQSLLNAYEMNRTKVLDLLR